MIKTKVVLAVGLGLVALLAVIPLAGARKGKGPAPDLIVTKVSKPPATAVVGSKITVVVKLRNKGSVKAKKSRVALYLAKGKKHAKKDRRLKRAKVKSLRAGKKGKAKLKVTLPGNAAPGTYRLIACADDTKKVRESKEKDNCRATKKFKLTPPPAPGAAAFTMTDGLDWGFVTDSENKEPAPGEPVTATLRAANGFPGQAGYARSDVAPQPLLTGATTTCDYTGKTNSEDDGQVTVSLPFAFPFGGISEQTISVSTNGWVSFGAPAWDYWDDTQPYDYRGVPALVGEVYRGIMPYWADLDVSNQGAGAGTVREVIAADGSAVAFQWDLGQHSGGGVPRRVFQVVLFSDGRFRLDYPGINEAGGNKSFVGFSLGTGPASATVVSAEGESVPGSSVLFTPNPVAAGLPLPAGQLSTTLPAGSNFIAGGPGCGVTVAPTAFTTGVATCPIASLGVGQQGTQTVTFAMPPEAPGESSPANFRIHGSFTASGIDLRDSDEIDALNTSLEPAENEVKISYTGPNPPKANTPAEYAVTVSSPSQGFDEPSLKLRLPANSTLSSILIAGQAIPCGPLEGANITCQLPSGTTSTTVDVKVVPTEAAIGSKLSLEATAQALNAPPKSFAVIGTEAVVP
jgi:CARDB